MSDHVPYPENILNAFNHGAVMDLRLQLAVEFLKGGAITCSGAKEAATLALDLANELVTQSEVRGYIKPMPDTSDLSASLKKHVERNVNTQLHGNHFAAREQRVGTSQIIPGMTIPQQ